MSTLYYSRPNKLQIKKKNINDNSNNVKSLTNIYEFYLNNNKNILIISKNYFEKFAKDTLNEYIDQDGIIDNSLFD